MNKVKFKDVPVGRFFGLNSEKYPNECYVKIPRYQFLSRPSECKCGDTTWVAMNLSPAGPWRVHFCPNTEVQFNIHSETFHDVMEAVFPPGE